MIAFVGSVFSPYYFAARKRGPAAAEDHCAINVALYGPKRRWAMTEHAARHVARDTGSFTVGASSLRWNGDSLAIDINARCAPLPWPLRGRIELQTRHLFDAAVALDENGRHFWRPVAPEAHVEVAFESPSLRWSGQAYHDMNWGSEPLERGFREWTWARAHASTGTRVTYVALRADGSRQAFGLSFSGHEMRSVEIPPTHRLSNGFWGMERAVHSESAPKLIATLEDAPFYTRNHVRLGLDGQNCSAIHESLSLGRFSHPITQWMLPFRMPRKS